MFNLEEANELVILIKKITEKHHEELNSILQQIELETSIALKETLKVEAQAIVDSWNKKIKKLGAKPSGVWFADLDFGEGYFCWKYPEEKITFWHGYNEGFTKRKFIEDKPLKKPKVVENNFISP